MSAWGMQDDKAWLRLSGLFLKAAATGLVVGLIFAFLLGRSVWLEMRVNVGHVIPASVVLSVLFCLARKRAIRLAPFLLLELLAVVLIVLLSGSGFPALSIIPAAYLRDGLHLDNMTLTEVNLPLVCVLGTLNIGWIGAAITKRKGEEK